MAAKQKKTTTSKVDPARFKRLADHLQQSRRNRRLSIRKVAQLANLPESTVRALENPTRSDLPSSNVIGLYKVYASALEVPQSRVRSMVGDDPAQKPEFSFKRIPELKSLVVFSNIGVTISIIIILFGVLGYAAWQGFGLVASPSISITSPSEQFTVVDEAVIEVSGSAEREATVLVNGEPTTVNGETGDFSETVFLQRGYNYIMVEVVNSFSTRTTETFVVIYQPSTQSANTFIRV